MLKILFISDINGKIARQTIKQVLPELKKEFKIDLTIANAENLTHGKGVSQASLEEMIQAGVDWFTNGDHCFDKEIELYEKELPILRPANYAPGTPGKGYALIKVAGQKILLVNLIGRVFMPANYDCPFRASEQILSNLAKKNLSAIIVDIHAEATSEKLALKHFLDGKISALIGTHTHVMTADAQITSQGMAYLTDVGMVGYADGVIGLDKENIIKTFLDQIKHPHQLPEHGGAIFNAVVITIDPQTKKATVIKPITKFINI